MKLKKESVIVVGFILACWGLYWLYAYPTKTVEVVVNNYNPYLPSIANAKVTITGFGENETFTSNSTGEAGPFHLRQSYSYDVSVAWQSLRYSKSLTVPQGDRVDLLIVIDTESMTVKNCEFLVISQIIDI